MDLKERLIKVGEQSPSLRRPVATVISALENKGKAADTKKKKKEDIVPEPLPPEEKEKPSVITISSDAIRAFNSELLPQIELWGGNFNCADFGNLIEEIAVLGTGKNSDLENSLIRYKPVSITDAKFWEQVQEVFNSWLRNKITDK